MLRFRINWSGVNSGFSVMHTGSAPAAAQADADALDEWLQDIAGTMVVTQQFQVDQEVEEVDPATGNITGVVTITSINRTGNVNTAPVPQAAQALFRWRTGFYSGGREVRGRTFVPGLALANSSASGELASATVATLQTAGTTLLADSGFGIWSPARATFQVATACSVWNEFAVMRGRRD